MTKIIATLAQVNVQAESRLDGKVVNVDMGIDYSTLSSQIRVTAFVAQLERKLRAINAEYLAIPNQFPVHVIGLLERSLQGTIKVFYVLPNNDFYGDVPYRVSGNLYQDHCHVCGEDVVVSDNRMECGH